MLRNLIAAYAKEKIPEIPEAIKTIEIPAINMSAFTTIWKELPTPLLSVQPKPMENYGQNQGLILYSTKLIGHHSGNLTITEPHDFAMVFVDGKLIDTIHRDGGRWTVKLPKTDTKNPTLQILVEGMGHINFAQFMIDRKGITDRVTLNGMTLMNWQTFLLPLDEKFIKTLKPKYPEGFHDGIFFNGNFTLDELGDTFFDMSSYSKGVVYINGHNLGRYWNVGPQQRLYCPASWLKKGNNEIVVLDLLQKEAPAITGKKEMNP